MRGGRLGSWKEAGRRGIELISVYRIHRGHLLILELSERIWERESASEQSSIDGGRSRGQSFQHGEYTCNHAENLFPRARELAPLFHVEKRRKRTSAIHAFSVQSKKSANKFKLMLFLTSRFPRELIRGWEPSNSLAAYEPCIARVYDEGEYSILTLRENSSPFLQSSIIYLRLAGGTSWSQILHTARSKCILAETSDLCRKIREHADV